MQFQIFTYYMYMLLLFNNRVLTIFTLFGGLDFFWAAVGGGGGGGEEGRAQS